MTDAKQYNDSDGDFSGWIELKEETCYKCKKIGGMKYKEWDSSCGGYTDYKYHCDICNEGWWVDGPDS